MSAGFATGLLVVIVIASIVGLMSLIARTGPYEEIERGGLVRAEAEPPGAAHGAERDAEIRQMLEARSARIVSRGGKPLDVDAEMTRLALFGADAPGPAAPDRADGDGDDRADAG